MLWAPTSALAGNDVVFVGAHQALTKPWLPKTHVPSSSQPRDGPCGARTAVLWTSLIAMSCRGSRKISRKPQLRREFWGGLLSTSMALPASASAAEMCEGSVFNGTWTIPESLGGKASISVRDGTAVITGSKGGKTWELRSTNIQGAPLVFRIAGVQRQFWVDWTPLGGKPELRGVWQGGMLDGPLATGPPEIKWDDGSRWRKVSCIAD